MVIQLFSSGTMDYSVGALRLLEMTHTSGQELLTRHVQGDWGNFGSYQATEISQGDRRMAGGKFPHRQNKLNKLAIDNCQGRVWSEYEIGNQKIWLITESIEVRGPVTRLLLPGED
ncbi:MAG: hypothetical protein F6K19_39645 [Cyanothece sp. SIO1E1]|nr:hypothetical protein [Cyanothece sp. SIO1E1]